MDEYSVRWNYREHHGEIVVSAVNANGALSRAVEEIPVMLLVLVPDSITVRFGMAPQGVSDLPDVDKVYLTDDDLRGRISIEKINDFIPREFPRGTPDLRRYMEGIREYGQPGTRIAAVGDFWELVNGRGLRLHGLPLPAKDLLLVVEGVFYALHRTQ